MSTKLKIFAVLGLAAALGPEDIGTTKTINNREN